MLGGLLYFFFRGLRIARGIPKEWCICLGAEDRVIGFPQPVPSFAFRAAPPAVTLSVDEQENCRERYAGSMLG